MEPNERTIRAVPTQEGYDQWSEIYDDYANPLIALEEPEVCRLLGSVADLDVLDVACGTGRHALWMARAGARVTAIDFSKGMLREAQEKPDAHRIQFLQHDLLEPLPFGNDSFDRVVHCLAIDHLGPPVEILKQFQRTLRPGGRAVVSLMHPAMFLKGTQARFVEPHSGDLVVIENHQYSISQYAMAIRDSGLELISMEEHRCTAEIAGSSPRAQKYLDWPMLFTFVAAKPGLQAPHRI